MKQQDSLGTEALKQNLLAPKSTFDWQRGILRRSSEDIKVTMPELSRPITREVVIPTEEAPTSPESRMSTLMNDIKKGIITPEEAVYDAIPDPYIHIKDVSVKDLKVEVMPSGFACFDNNYVLRKEMPDIVMLVAYTSHGKSAMALQMAEYVSRSGPVFVHSFEMSHKSLKTRLLSAHMREPSGRIKKGDIAPHKLEKANEWFEGSNLHICKDMNPSISFIESSCFRKSQKTGNPRMIVLDYVQQIEGPMGRDTKVRELGDIMRRIKGLASRFNCTVLITAQMNRGCLHRGKDESGKYRPTMNDIADSSQMAKDADVVIAITRQQLYDGTRHNIADIVCLKNRDDDIFEKEFTWQGYTTTFSEPAL